MNILILILISIGILAVMFIFFGIISKAKDKYVKSDFEQAEIYKNELIVLSHIHHSGGDSGDAYQHSRLVNIDINTGTQLAKNIYERELSIQKILGNILILKGGNILSAYNIQTKKLILDKEILREMHPIVKDEHIANMKLDDHSTIVVVTNKGNEIKIPIESITTFDNEILPPKPKRHHEGQFTFRKSTAEKQFNLVYQSQIIGNRIYLNPQEIAEWNEQVIFMHSDTLSEHAPLSIDAVDTKGNTLWSISNRSIHLQHDVEYQIIELKYETIYKDLLVLIFEAKTDRMMGIDLKTGKVIWNHRI